MLFSLTFVILQSINHSYSHMLHELIDLILTEKYGHLLYTVLQAGSFIYAYMYSMCVCCTYALYVCMNFELLYVFMSIMSIEEANLQRRYAHWSRQWNTKIIRRCVPYAVVGCATSPFFSRSITSGACLASFR